MPNAQMSQSGLKSIIRDIEGLSFMIMKYKMSDIRKYNLIKNKWTQ